MASITEQMIEAEKDNGAAFNSGYKDAEAADDYGFHAGVDMDTGINPDSGFDSDILEPKADDGPQLEVPMEDTVDSVFDDDAPALEAASEQRGFSQFLLGRLEKVQQEWFLLCNGHSPFELLGYGEGQSG